MTIEKLIDLIEELIGLIDKCNDYHCGCLGYDGFTKELKDILKRYNYAKRIY